MKLFLVATRLAMISNIKRPTCNANGEHPKYNSDGSYSYLDVRRCNYQCGCAWYRLAASLSISFKCNKPKNKIGNRVCYSLGSEVENSCHRRIE